MLARITLFIFLGIGCQNLIRAQIDIGSCFWLTKDLNVDTLPNGDLIELARNHEEWLSFYNKNIPAYFKDIKTLNEPIFLYNWHAVEAMFNSKINYRNILIPDYSDLSDPNCLRAVEFTPSSMYNGAFGSVTATKKAGYNQPYWMPSILKYYDNRAMIYVVNTTNNSLSIDTTYSKMDGFPIRCLYNLNLPGIELNYSAILPEKMEEINLDLSKLIFQESNFNELKNIEVIGELKFDSLGKNISKNLKFNNELNKVPFSDDLVKNLNNYVQSLNSNLVYQQKPIASFGKINLNISFYKDEQEIYDISIYPYYGYQHFDGNSELESLIKENKDKIFKYNTQTYRLLSQIKVFSGLDIFEESYSLKSSNTNYLFLTKVDVMGPINAFRSFLFPGLGVRKFDYSYKNIKTGKILRNSAIFFLSSTILSKSISSMFHNKYKNDLFHDEMNYKLANDFHHASIISFGGFLLAGLTDFGISFSIGAKNLLIKKKINNELFKYNNKNTRPQSGNLGDYEITTTTNNSNSAHTNSINTESNVESKKLERNSITIKTNYLDYYYRFGKENLSLGYYIVLQKGGIEFLNRELAFYKAFTSLKPFIMANIYDEYFLVIYESNERFAKKRLKDIINNSSISLSYDDVYILKLIGL